MSQFFKTKHETENWLFQMGVENYTINKNLTVDVDGSVFLYKKDLHILPVKFGIVNGDFHCQENKIKSLIGSPKFVSESFFCGANKLKSLEGAPDFVGNEFDCLGNFSLGDLQYIEDLPTIKTILRKQNFESHLAIKNIKKNKMKI